MKPTLRSDAHLTFLVGPTAAGKSALALDLARETGAEILSLDSMQVYRGMDVGTAKPGAAEQAKVRHHLIDLVDPPERYHVHRYLEDAARALLDVEERGRRALFVGGTALYLKALTHGLFEGPIHDPDAREQLNRRAEQEGSQVLHEELAAVDPKAASRVHPNDAKRIVRGLEVFQASGRPLSDLQRERGEWGEGRPRTLVGLSPAPERLEQRIRQRTRTMLEEGWVEEVRGIQAGCGFGSTSRQALGYAEILEHLEGGLPLSELEERIVLRTRQFARRQRTWLRGFPETRWVDPEAPGALERALELLAT